jgi:small ligand-binding sensory domain FIST
MPSLFRHGHATHPDWRTATELCAVQLAGQAKQSIYSDKGQLGVVYVTLAYAKHLQEIAQLLALRTQVADWVGTSAPSIVATGVEYADEPAISVLLVDAPDQSIEVFSGKNRLTGQAAHSALVHADSFVPEIEEVVRDMANKTSTGHIFGGIGSGETFHPDSLRPQYANQLIQGGLSGAVFSAQVPIITKITQGCSPLGREHRVSKAQGNYLQRLDESPALDVLLEDLDVEHSVRASSDGEVLLQAIPAQTMRQGLLVGTAPALATGAKVKPTGFSEFIVRQVLGIDPQNRVVATAAQANEGDRLVFCTRNQRTARADLLRLCSELRDELDEKNLQIRGAVYVSCTGRGANSFGAVSAETQLIHSQLGEFPLTGFFANGEIANGQLYGFTGVLSVFV